MSEETIKNMFYFGWDMFPGEVIISLIVMLLLAIISFVIYFLFKNADPTKPEKGFRLVIVMLVEKVEAFTVDIMGEKFRSFAGYAIAVGGYIAFSFIFGLLGLPGPMTYLGNTLSIALCTFGLIHFTAMKKNKWGYFKRYIDPFAIMLPINLLSMWAPLLSLSLRLFGNALAGYTLMSIVYFFLGFINDMAIINCVCLGICEFTIFGTTKYFIGDTYAFRTAYSYYGNCAAYFCCDGANGFIH